MRNKQRLDSTKYYRLLVHEGFEPEDDKYIFFRITKSRLAVMRNGEWSQLEETTEGEVNAAGGMGLILNMLTKSERR